MNKTTKKRMFNAIQDGDAETLSQILDAEPEAIEVVGEHNRYVRDKTPLMFAMQCRKLQLAHALLDRGANAAAEMPGGPRYSALLLCMDSAYCDSEGHDEWIRLATRLIDKGADPNSGLWPALHGFGGIVDRADLIRLSLERGADPDRQLGNSGNTVRELVKINRHLYSAEVLALFDMA
jgi:ankyrin repeat protein